MEFTVKISSSFLSPLALLAMVFPWWGYVLWRGRGGWWVFGCEFGLGLVWCRFSWLFPFFFFFSFFFLSHIGFSLVLLTG